MPHYKNKYEQKLAEDAEKRAREEEARKQADLEAKERRASRSALKTDLGISRGLVDSGPTRGLSIDEQTKLSKANWKRELDDKFPVTGSHPYELVFDDALNRMLDLNINAPKEYSQLLDWAAKNVADGFSIERISSSVEKTLAQWEQDKTWRMPAPLRTAPQRKM